MTNYTKFLTSLMLVSTLLLGSCSDVPDNADMPRVDVPQPSKPTANMQPAGINSNREAPIVYVRLGKDTLRPKITNKAPLPPTQVGPFELRDETLGAALQLVLGDKNVPIAYQTTEAQARTVTVSGLRGELDDVVDRLCLLAGLYCTYEQNMLVIKDTETFSVALPPVAADDSYTQIASGVAAITGGTPLVDKSTRTLIYNANARTNQRVSEYFDRLRGNTALIVYEMQIWQVILNTGNQNGVNWSNLSTAVSNFDINLKSAAQTAATATGTTGVGLIYNSSDVTFDGVFEFLAKQGAVKTISQPQVTVLSGSEAKLRVGNKQNYVSQITRTATGGTGTDNLSAVTSTIETGLTMTIGSAWDNSTVYGNLKLELQDLIKLDNFDVGGSKIQLPRTSDRLLETRLRIRPGDVLIIGGIVSEADSLSTEGLGIKAPLIPNSNVKSAENSELVFMMRPRVVVYTDNPPPGATVVEDDYATPAPVPAVPVAPLGAAPMADYVQP